ncbi:MAG: hypothetical protein V4736_05965 [Bdellovibrionota bacterium]
MNKLLIVILTLISTTVLADRLPQKLTLHRIELTPDSASVFFEGSPAAPTPAPATPVPGFQNPLDVLTQAEGIVDRIINIGKKIWDVVDKGKAVVNQTYNVAHALPENVRNWTQLAGWQVPRSKLYEIYYTNGFGAKVVRFIYRLTFTYGGNVDGTGRYLTGIRVQPATLNVAWGFNFDVVTEVPEVYNMGTTRDPLAAANIIVRWQLRNGLTNITETDQYMVNGTGKIVPLQ